MRSFPQNVIKYKVGLPNWRLNLATCPVPLRCCDFPAIRFTAISRPSIRAEWMP